MQNSIVWIASVFLSIAAHYGLMAAAGQIPLPEPGQDQLAQVVLGGGAFQAVTLDAIETEQAASAEVSDTLMEPSATGVNEAAPAVADAAEPQRSDEITQSGALQESESASPEAELSPANTAEAASQAGDAAAVDAAAVAEPAAALAAEAAAPPVQEAASIASGETPPAAEAPLAPVQDTAPAALAVQETPSIGALPAPVVEAPSAPVIAEAQPDTQQPAAAGPAAVPELSSAGNVQELAPAAPATDPAPNSAAAERPLEQGTKLAAAITAPAPAMSQGDRVRSFLRDYRGNGCIYARAGDVDAARPSFSGLGGESGAVEEFASSFRQAVGVEPELALRKVMDAQCPVVDFMKAIVGDERQNLEVVLDQDVIQDGGMLIGRLEGHVQGEIMLLLVDDDGAVRDITSDFHRLPNGNFFGIPVSLLGQGRGRNQLVLALASVDPLNIEVTRKSGEAATLFNDLARKISAGGFAVRTAYAAFRVQ